MSTSKPGGAESQAGRDGGRILHDALQINGVDRIFSVPGESCLPLFEALRTSEQVDLVVCRHEAGACHMAEADGKLRGEPGVCVVSRGPGAMQASVGLHMAQQNSTPLILIVGQVPRGFRGREAFQEMNYTSVFEDSAKWVTEIQHAHQIPEVLRRAFQIATGGRPGPVVLAIPEDVFDEHSEVADLPRYQHADPAPPVGAIDALRERLNAARQPLVIVGGPRWSDIACQNLMRFVEAFDLPVVAGFRCQDLVDNRHPNFSGYLAPSVDPKLRARIRSADLLLVIGERLGEPSTQSYTLLDPAVAHPQMVHVLPGAEELGRVYSAGLNVHAAPGPFLEALAALKPRTSPQWRAWREAARADYQAFHAPIPTNGALDLSRVMAELRACVPDDTVVTNGAGNYTAWVSRFFEFRGRTTQIAPQGGAMGYGYPAALAAKLRHPDRTVVAFAGDGCFLMAATEIATAMQRKLPVIAIIINNGIYGAIRAHQERAYPGRVVGTELHNPNFAELARSFGGFGAVVTETSAFKPALEQALASGLPSVIELRVDPDELSPGVTVQSLRAKHS